MHVSRILGDKRLDMKGKRQAVWNYFLTHEIMAGTQFLVTSEGTLYAALGATNEVLQLPRAGRGGDRWHSYMQTMYGVGEREDHSKWVYDVLRSYVIAHGIKVDLRRFAMFNQIELTTYLSTYDGRMYKVEGSEAINVVPMGEDGVFFADDDRGVPVEPDIGPHGMLLDRLTNLNFSATGLSGITADQQRMALTIWIFALAFPDLLPNKPILMIEGTKGSGKTSSVVFTQLALMGLDKPMLLQRNKEDDFLVILLRSPIALFDNTDSYIDWVPDSIAAYCTGAGQDKRKLYTDDESVSIKPHAFIAVATRNPASFRRDDVADRCIILRLERRASFDSMALLKRHILADRPQLFGEYLWFVGKIVDDLREQAEAGIEFGIHETHRMADFAAFGRTVGRVLGWEEIEVEKVMTALQRERDSFIGEEDPLSDLLMKWVTYKQRAGVVNAGRIVTIFTLHAELESLAQGHSIEWKDGTRALANKLRSDHLEREFRIEQLVIGGHKSYQIWKRSHVE